MAKPPVSASCFRPGVPVEVTVESHDGKPLPCRMHGIFILPPKRIGHLTCWGSMCFIALWQDGRKLLRYGPLVPSRLIAPDYEKILHAQRLPAKESLRSTGELQIKISLNSEIFSALVAMARRAGVRTGVMARIIVSERVETEMFTHARRLKQRRLEAQRVERQKTVDTATAE